MGGKVILVGAGPGDAGLMTVKGRRALEQAEVVVFDRLVDAGGPLAQVVDADFEDPLLDGLAQQRVAQRVEVVREDGDHVEAHAAHSSSSPSGGVITIAPLSTSTMGTSAWT